MTLGTSDLLSILTLSVVPSAAVGLNVTHVLSFFYKAGLLSRFVQVFLQGVTGIPEESERSLN